MYKILYDHRMFSLLSRFILDCIIANPLESISALSNYYGSAQTIIYAISNRCTDFTIQMLKDVLQQQMCTISNYDLNICLKLSIVTNNFTLFSNIIEYIHQQRLIVKTFFLDISSSTHIFIYSIMKDMDNFNINTNLIFNWESTSGRPFDREDIIFDNNNDIYLSDEMIEYIDNLYLSITNIIENHLDKFQYLNTILHYFNINNIPISRMLRFYYGNNKYILNDLIAQKNVFIIMYLLHKYHMDTNPNSNTFTNCFCGDDSIIDLHQYLMNNDPYSTIPFNPKPFTNLLLISKLIHI